MHADFLFGKLNIIEEESMVACDIKFSDIIRGMDLGDHRGQFVDGFTTVLRHLLGIAIMTVLVNHVVEDIDQRMLEDLAILVQVIFGDGLESHADGTIPAVPPLCLQAVAT